MVEKPNREEVFKWVCDQLDEEDLRETWIAEATDYYLAHPEIYARDVENYEISYNYRTTYDSALSDIPQYGADHPTYWGAAVCGEAGELADITKKWERDGLHKTAVRLSDKGIDNYLYDRARVDPFTSGFDEEMAERLVKACLGDELADIVIYCKLMAEEWGIDLPQAIQDKKAHNETKRRVG